MEFPLETARLLIRPIRPEDAEQLHAVYGDPDVMRWIPSGPADSLETTRRRVARYIDEQDRSGFSLWAVIERASGRVIGDCGLFPVEGRGPEVELAYRLGRSAWGRGYATEAAATCLRYGCERLGLDRIIAITDPDHTASRRVIEKLGMSYDGTRKFYGREMVQYAATRPTAGH